MNHQTSSQTPYFYTTDLALTATLSLWHPVEAIDKSNPRKAQFVFVRDPELEERINLYWRNEIKVEPQAYFGQIKKLKARLYD